MEDDSNGLTLSTEEEDGFRFLEINCASNESPVRGLMFSLVAAIGPLWAWFGLEDELNVVPEVSSSRNTENVGRGMICGRRGKRWGPLLELVDRGRNFVGMYDAFCFRSRDNQIHKEHKMSPPFDLM